MSKTNQAGKPTFIIIPINEETSLGFLKEIGDHGANPI